MTTAKKPPYASRPIRPETLAVLDQLKPGDRIRVTQLVRVGFKTWQAQATGIFRCVDSLATGLATQRVAEDDIIVAVLHFIKDPHAELSSIALDEHTRIEIV